MFSLSYLFLGPVPWEREIIKRPLTAPASYTIGKWSEEMYGDRIQGPAGSYYTRYIVYTMIAARRSQASPTWTSEELESHSGRFCFGESRPVPLVMSGEAKPRQARTGKHRVQQGGVNDVFERQWKGMRLNPKEG